MFRVAHGHITVIDLTEAAALEVGLDLFPFFGGE